MTDTERILTEAMSRAVKATREGEGSQKWVWFHDWCYNKLTEYKIKAPTAATAGEQNFIKNIYNPSLSRKGGANNA